MNKESRDYAEYTLFKSMAHLYYFWSYYHALIEVPLQETKIVGENIPIATKTLDTIYRLTAFLSSAVFTSWYVHNAGNLRFLYEALLFCNEVKHETKAMLDGQEVLQPILTFEEKPRELLFKYHLEYQRSIKA